VIGQETLCLTGIHEPAERDQQDGRTQVTRRGVFLERVQIGWVLHRYSPLSLVSTLLTSQAGC